MNKRTTTWEVRSLSATKKVAVVGVSAAVLAVGLSIAAASGVFIPPADKGATTSAAGSDLEAQPSPPLDRQR